MTQKEIKTTRESIRGLLFKDMTLEQRLLYEELACREMINSCLCYHGIKGGKEEFYKVCTWRWGSKSYAQPYIDSLGKDRVEELFKEQEKDFKKATVKYNVATDSDGVSYNSIIWADEVS